MHLVFKKITKLLKIKYLILNIFLILLFSTFYLLHATDTYATDPAPSPYVNCNDIRPPNAIDITVPIFGRIDISIGGEWEFNSLRPYQASPCNEAPPAPSPPKEPQALLCGNDLVFKEAFEKDPGQAISCTNTADGGRKCNFKETSTVNVSIDLSKSELPILGNTEDVPNSKDNSEKMPEAERINQYVSWYLNGTLNRGEFLPLGPNPIDLQRLVDLSGPLNKLLPQRIQWNQREKTIQDALDSTDNGKEARHNQMVGCTLKGPYGEIPWPCYGINTDNLSDEDLLSLIKATAVSPGALKVLDLFRLTDWIKNPVLGQTNNLPPKRTDFDKFEDYWKAYLIWRGQICTPSLELFGKKLYACVNISPNYYAWLFPNIPYSSTEDKKGEVEFKPEDFQEGENPQLVFQPQSNDYKITSLTSNFTDDQRKKYLYFPHTAESAELGELLQKTYLPQGQTGLEDKPADNSPADQNPEAQPADSSTTTSNELYNTGRCDVLDSRTNPGDDLFGEYPEDGDSTISGSLTYTTEFSCDFPGAHPRNFCEANCDAGDQECMDACLGNKQTCTQEVTVAAGSVYTSIPKGDEIFDRLVNGPASIFKRIFPKVGLGTPVDTIKDIPAVTQAEYQASAATGNSVQAFAGEPTGNRPGSDAQIFFAHLGSVSEYFMNGIQAALRPKGFANQPLTGTSSTGGPGELPGGPGTPGSGTCDIIEGSSPYCSVGYLQNYFGTTAKARIASRICNKESGAYPRALNSTCPDYSVGLFQINLRAHDITDPNTGERICCQAAFSGGSCTSVGSCTVVNEDLLKRCRNLLWDPDVNTRKAVEISGNGTNWNAWSTYTTYAACRQP